jgi:5'-nucleotidase / UDP-sugar diphosphatase
MKKSYLLLAFFLLVNFISNAQDTLTILHLNDTHSTLSALGPRNPDLSGTQGGVARAAGVIAYTRFTNPNVLTLHSGDAFIGDLFFNVYFGAAEFLLLNAIGVDAMTVGNHEWDLTPSILDTSLKASFNPGEGFPLLSANTILDDPAVESLKDYILPFTIKQVGNLKVGIFGMTTPETNVTSMPSPAVISDDLINITLAMVDSLTANSCDIIIMLSHLGFALDQTLAENIPGINIIISGHDHYVFENPVEVLNPGGTTTYIVQANSNYLCIGKLQLTVNAGSIDLLDYQMIHLDESVQEPVAIKNEVDNLIAGVEAVYGPVFTQQIGYAAETFEEVADSLMFPGNHDTPVGNFVTDAFRLKTGTDVAIEAGGSTALPFYEGPLVGADAFRVVGYGFNTVNGLGFRLVTFDILGSDLWAALEYCLATIEANDEFLPQVSGMKYIYNPDSDPGSRIKAIYIGENIIDPSATYTVTGNELLVSLLTGLFEIPISNFFCYDSLSEFQVLSEYIALQQTISPIVEGRIVADNSTGVDDYNVIPEGFELNQNYPNPFNPTTIISWQSPVGSRQTLKVYDLIGREVAKLVDEYKPAGRYEIKWDASGLATGVYFYKLQAGSFVETKKLILMK